MSERTLRILEFARITEQLAGYAGSPMGKDLCRKLEPLSGLTEIRRMQEETTAALRRIYKKGSVSFAGVRDVRPSLLRLKVDASIGIAELLALASTLEAAGRVREYGRREIQDEERDCLDPLFKLIEPCPQLSREIRRCILDEETIADDASPGLKSVRRQIKQTNDKIHSQLSAMVSSQAVGLKLQDAIITQRGGRYCLPVKAEYRSQFPGMIHDQSSSGATLFIEPMAVVKLNNDLSQLAAKEKEEIDKVLDTLSQLAAQSQGFIAQNISLLSSLDFIFARAHLSRSYNGSEPVFNESGYIHIKKARHPLLDKKKVVPIDIRLGYTPYKPDESEFSMLIVTGPNTGGKTVSLKTTGLLTIMGECGLHIPAAENSQLSTFDEVYADIGDEQSIEQSLSTFSAHMTNIVDILSKAGDRSLVLLDELCAGTDPVEGASLAISILKNLLGRGVTTMATTHYSELKVFALDTSGVSNASCEFDLETLSPTYRLLIGLPGKSNAFAISGKLGLPEPIIEDAQRGIDTGQQNFEDLLSDLERSRITIEKEQEEIKRYRQEAEDLRKKLEAKRENIDAQKQRILDEAREKAKNILQDAKDYADHTIRTMNKLSAGGGADMKAMERERTKVRQKLERASGKEAATRAAALRGNQKYTPEDFPPGQSVLVISMNVRGTVVGKPDSKGNIQVQMGILKSRVPYTDLVPARDEEERRLSASLDERVKDETEAFRTSVRAQDTSGAPAKAGGPHSGSGRNAGSGSKSGKGKKGSWGAGRNIASVSGSGAIRMDKSATAVTSINLIGKTVDEALSELDKFLDDAYLAHIPNVTVIHGRGTGALRKAVHEKLRKTSYVTGYRLGTFGEGETGVTIVELA